MMPPHVLAAPPKTEGLAAPFALKDALPVLLQEEQQAAEDEAAPEAEGHEGPKRPDCHAYDAKADQHTSAAGSEQMAKRQRTMTACA